MKRALSIFLLVVSCFNLFACSDNSPNNHTPNISTEEQAPNISIEEETKPTVIKLTTYNYSSYLNISINQTAQSQTLISHKYYVEYQYGKGSSYAYYTGLTPPTTNNVLNCTYICSNYSISTTFTIKCHSKNKDYVFSNTNFSIAYRASASQYSSITVYLSQDGNGSSVFMMSEEFTRPNKSYSLQASNMISDFNGEVSLFNNN